MRLVHHPELPHAVAGCVESVHSNFPRPFSISRDRGLTSHFFLTSSSELTVRFPQLSTFHRHTDTPSRMNSECALIPSFLYHISLIVDRMIEKRQRMMRAPFYNAYQQEW